LNAGVVLCSYDKVPPSKYKGNNLKKWLKDMAQKANFGKDHVKDDAVALLEKLLSLDPAKRITAVEAIRVRHESDILLNISKRFAVVIFTMIELFSKGLSDLLQE
jgi:serine/threonine protein kinase